MFRPHLYTSGSVVSSSSGLSRGDHGINNQEEHDCIGKHLTHDDANFVTHEETVQSYAGVARNQIVR